MKSIEMSDYNRAAKGYWFAVVALGAITFLWALVQCAATFTPVEWGRFLALLSIVVIASAYPIRIPNTQTSFTATDAFTFLGIVFLGVPAGVILGVADLLIGALRTSKRATSWLVSPATMALPVFAAGHVFYFTLDYRSGINMYPLGTLPVGFDDLLVPLILTACALFFLNAWAVAALHALKNRRSVWQYWRNNQVWTFMAFFASAVAAALIHNALVNFGFLHVLLAALVIGASYATYKVYFERVNEKTREAAEMSRLHLATVEALATAIDAKDQTTHCHVRRVQIYAGGMGKLFQLTDDEIKALHAGALLHDIGKLAVPDHILNKPGELTPAEFDRMKIHTTIGAQILERVGFPYPVAPIVLHHHERWDGCGYPEGLRGEQIPITARIIAVVDTFDTVREDRPYRRGMTREEASALMRRGANTHFDPTIVEMFLRHLPHFEAEITEAGLDVPGFTQQECDARGLVACDTKAEATGGSVAPAPNPVPPVTKTSANVISGVTGPLSYPAHGQPAYLDQIRDAHREVYALYEIARTFGSSLDLQDIVAITVNKIGNVVPFDTCAVYLYDEQKGYATIAHASGRNADKLRDRTISLGEGVAGFVLANRYAISHFDPMLDFTWLDVAPDERYKSVAALPLVRGDQLLGALAVYSIEVNRYTDDHLRLLDMVARLASDALANAVHHAEMESNALTDALTGLPNARALQVRFEEEAARARRTRRSFQVVMLDLDDFKLVNDTYGHKTGDLLLREVGRVLQHQLREYDFLARYAGDEFVALVQDVDEQGITEMRERIERAVNGFQLHVRGDKHARVGISIGTAAFTTHGETLDGLLIAADAEMYRRKSDHKQARQDENANLDTPDDFASTAVN
jgi:diguanylate cyclase (GGDEF)-like protein/putative nucleotidyltransferase with HDIG domain